MQGNKALSSEVSPRAVGDWSIHVEGITPATFSGPLTLASCACQDSEKHSVQRQQKTSFIVHYSFVTFFIYPKLCPIFCSVDVLFQNFQFLPEDFV